MLNATTAVGSRPRAYQNQLCESKSLNRGDLVAQRGVSPHFPNQFLVRPKAAAVDEDVWEGVVGTLMPPPACNLRSIVP